MSGIIPYLRSVCARLKTSHQPRGHRVALEDGPCGENPAGRPGEAPEHDPAVQRLVLDVGMSCLQFHLFLYNHHADSRARMVLPRCLQTAAHEVL